MSKTLKILEHLAHHSARWTSSAWAFVLAVTVTIIWLFLGKIYHFSNGWQLVMDTISSVTTFIMVFLLQRSQAKNSMAMQIKLNEIIASIQGANNRLINIEDLSEEEIFLLHRRYQELASEIHNTREPSVHKISV